MYFKNRLCHFFTIRDITKHFQYKNVKESNRNIKMYSASVSHEMLNPIKCILEFTSQIKTKLDDRQFIRQNIEVLGLIYSAAKHLQY